jgi:hypothetical protein
MIEDSCPAHEIDVIVLLSYLKNDENTDFDVEYFQRAANHDLIST